MDSIAKARMASPPRIPTGLIVPNLSPYSPYSPSSSSSPPAFSSSVSPSSNILPPASPPAVVLSPCAACKVLRRRCVDKCVLAPYFPPSEPLKFTIAHRVFGASNIIKLLQELPEDQRADAVSSMVYEANARIRDPVYGSAGAICHLQKQVSELQTQLARAQADLLNMQLQQSNLINLFCVEMGHSLEENQTPLPFSHLHQNSPGTTPFLNDPSNWGSLWT